MSHPHRAAPPARPLLITAVPDLLEDVLRLAVAAGADLHVEAEPGAARAAWGSAPLALVGADATEACAAAALPRRPGVVLLGLDLDDADVWRQAVRIGAEHVVFLPDAERWLVDELAETVDGGGRPAAVTVGVVGGRGGAGASTLAASLAVTAARSGRRPLLVDADALGGGIDLVLGVEGQTGLRWPDLAPARGRLGAGSLRSALPRGELVTVLSWDRGDDAGLPAEAMTAVLGAGARGHDLVVVDLPRRLDAPSAAAVQCARTVLVVVPAEVRACAAAQRVVASVAAHCPDVRVVVRGPAPAGLEAAAVANALDLPLAGVLRPEPGLAVALERGEPPAARGRGPLAVLCRSLLDDLVPLRAGEVPA